MVVGMMKLEFAFAKHLTMAKIVRRNIVRDPRELVHGSSASDMDKVRAILAETLLWRLNLWTAAVSTCLSICGEFTLMKEVQCLCHVLQDILFCSV